MKKNWKKNIILFLASQTISLFGSSLVQYAIMWYITLETKSGVMMTISIVCGFLPTFFLSPFAGVWADRYNRKVLIIVADSLIALATLILAILFFAGYQMIWLLFLMLSIRALGAAVQIPAIGAFIPQIVPEDKLTRTNAVNGSIQSLVFLISPMVSAALITMTTMEVIFLIDVVTAAIAIFILALFLQVPAHKKALEKQITGYFTDMVQGIDYIKKHNYLKSFFVFCAVFYVLGAPMFFLTPLQVTRTFGADVWRLTAVEITFSVGMIFGGVIMASWGGFKNRVHSMTLACVSVGAFTFALGIMTNFWIYLGFMSLIGVAFPFYSTPSMVLLQENVEEDMLGRVFGIFSMISSSMMPLGMLVFGPISDVVQIEWLLIVTGGMIFIQGFFLLGSKSLIEAGKPLLGLSGGRGYCSSEE